MNGRTLRNALFAGLSLAMLLASRPAAADAHMALQAGGFVPWQGDAGYSLSLQLLGSGASGRSRWGGEFEYRSFESRIVGVSDVDVESYILRGMWQHHFRPDALVTPYIGLGLGVSVNVVDDGKVDSTKGRNVRGSTGAGLDGIFLLGVRATLPGAEYMSLFAEGRVGAGFDVSDRNDESGAEVENMGGASGSAGIRFRF
jgi:hypothetical protein